MYFLTALLSALLPLCLALPTSTSVASSFTFQVVDFRAYITSDPGSNGQLDWAAFMIQESGFTCNVVSEVPIYSETTWYPCEPPKEGPEEIWSFRLSPGFSQVLVKRQWSSNGTYMTGLASQDTYWKEGEGGNVTVYEAGKVYDRFEQPWAFEITSVIG